MEETSKDSISNIIKQRRILLDLSQSELAETAGVSPSLIGRIETGTRYPSARTLRKLASALGISEIELFVHAEYLSRPSSSRIKEDTQIMQLDPKVIFELSKEPLKTQRTVLAILKMLKSLATDNISGNAKDTS